MSTSYHESDEDTRYWELYEKACREESVGFPVIYDPSRRVLFPGWKKRRDDETHRKRLVERYVAQIVEEGIWTYQHVAEIGWRTYRDGIKTPYKKFPRPGGVSAVVVEGGNRTLPRNKDRLTALVDEWVRTAPASMRIDGSKGFGGEYAGSKPPPKGNIKLYIGIGIAKARLKRDHVPHSEQGDEVRINMNEDKALKYVKGKLVGG